MAAVSTAAEAHALEAEADNSAGVSGLQFAVPTGTAYPFAFLGLGQDEWGIMCLTAAPGKEPSAGQLRERLQTRIEQMRRERKAVEEKKQRARAAREGRKQASGPSLPAPRRCGGERKTDAF